MRAPAVDTLHGSRSGYLVGCRCLPCRAAKARYESERRAAIKETGPGIVSAFKAREHMKRLALFSIGIRALADATDITPKVLRKIRSGEQATIRRKTAERILAVDHRAISDHALVPAAKTWQQINELLEEGYSPQYLAKRLGACNGVLEFNQSRVLAATAAKVDRLYRRLTL
jgi:hypothetical protein